MDENRLEKKKILFVITKGNFGGAQRYVYDLAVNLPQDKYEAVVACGKGNTLKTLLEEKNIRVIELQSSQRDINILKDVKTFFEIEKIIKQEKPQVLHVNSSKIGGLGALAGRISRVPKIIFTTHGWAFNENRGILEKILILFLHWLTVVFSHTTIAVSEKTKRDISWLPFIKNKIRVIHNGIGPFKSLTKQEARYFFVPKESKKVIVFSLSELHQNKGIDVALQGIALLPKEKREEIIYCIAGDGEERENLQNMANKLGISGMVKFLGLVENAKQFLAGTDIFLFPSRNENLPFAILEAGAQGLPIISTSVGGIPEVIKDMNSGILIHPRNPKEIAEAIMYMLDHKKKQKEFGREIKKTVSSFFSLEKMLRETMAVYS